MKTHILAATLVAAVVAATGLEHAGEPAQAPGTRTDAAPKQEIRLERLTPEYWRVTLDNPPFNLFGPETIPQLNSVITQMETDPKVKVVVFQSALPDAELDQFVDALARRIAGFDKQAIAAIKRLVDIPTLPSDIEIGAEWGAFLDSAHRPQAQQKIKRLMEMGLQTKPDVEKRLSYYTGTLAQ
jgi:enoyl-CoA hydratase/carnithine racemase